MMTGIDIDEMCNQISTTKTCNYSGEDTNARNGSQEKKPRKAKTKMGERHHGYVWNDDSSKQSGGGQASISQRHLGSDVLTRICSEEKNSGSNPIKLFTRNQRYRIAIDRYRRHRVSNRH